MAATPAASQLSAEGVEALVPEHPEPVEPHVDLLQRSWVDGVEPTRSGGPDTREPRLSEHPEVLRDRRLGDAELRLDPLGDRPRAQLAAGEKLEGTAPNRVAQDVEGLHGGTILLVTYISQVR